jgi:cytochrome c-type biogenesis protein CcmH/NrfF
MMKPKTLSRLLIAIGAALILYSQVMDVSVGSFGGERIVNIHLLSKQQNYLWLGGIALLAGILLFAMHRMKQSAEDERKEKESEEAAMREAVAKASAGASKSVAAFGSAVDTAVAASSDVIRQVAKFEPVSRLLVGVFVGLTFLIISYGFATAQGYPAWPVPLFPLAAILYSLTPGSAAQVKAHLLAANAVLLSLVLVIGAGLAMNPENDGIGLLLLLVAGALIVSLLWLYRIRKRARRMLSSTVNDAD